MKNTEKWRPKIGRKYYWLSSSTLATGFYNNLNKEYWSDSELDRSLLEKGNCFKSKKEAKFIYDSFRGHF